MRSREKILNLILIVGVMLAAQMGKLAMGNETASSLETLVNGLPGTIEEWEKSPDVSLYDADNLYTYINGGAELYISYKFINLISQPYVNVEDDEIKIDIFDMGSPQNAYGIFSHSREAIDDFVSSNIESEYAGGLLTFWKGRYYVSILAYPETESRKLVVQQLARKIAAHIQEEDVKPRIVGLLPADKLQPYSVRYFRHYTWMNMYHFFANKNLLNIDDETEAVMAKYIVDAGKPAVLILLDYPNEAAAADAQDSFKHNFMPGVEEQYTHDAEQLWTGCVRNKDLLVIVVDAPSLETAQRLVKGVK